MATLNWVPGAAGDVYDPFNWSPLGVPQPYNFLNINSGLAIVTGNGLQIDQVNLSGNALLLAEGPAALDDVIVHPAMGDFSSSDNPQIDVAGNAFLNIEVEGSTTQQTNNILPGSQLTGSMTVNGDDLWDFLEGSDSSTFQNIDSRVLGGGRLQIDANVVGGGIFELSNDPNIGFGSRASVIGFGSGVSAGQTIIATADSAVEIEDTKDFHASVILQSKSGEIGLPLVELNNLSFDTDSYQNDMLHLFNHGQDVYDLKVESPTGFSIRNEAVHSSYSVVITADPLYAPAPHPPPGGV